MKRTSVIITLALACIMNAFCGVCDAGAAPVAGGQDTVQQVDSTETFRMLALKSNLLYDVFYMPQYGFAPMWDAQVEFYPRNSRYTVNLQFTSPYWQKWEEHKFFQFRDYRFELRRYFREKGDYTGPYASVYGENTIFGIGLSDAKGWQGEGGGGGLQFGYVLPLSSDGRVRLEFSAGLGAFFCRYDPYVYGNPVTGTVDGQYYYDFLGSAEKFKARNHTFSWFGPTSIGVSLTYDILHYRDKKEKEVSR